MILVPELPRLPTRSSRLELSPAGLGSWVLGQSCCVLDLVLVLNPRSIAVFLVPGTTYLQEHPTSRFDKISQ